MLLVGKRPVLSKRFYHFAFFGLLQTRMTELCAEGQEKNMYVCYMDPFNRQSQCLHFVCTVIKAKMSISHKWMELIGFHGSQNIHEIESKHYMP